MNKVIKKEIDSKISKILKRAEKDNIYLKKTNQDVYNQMDIFGSKYLIRKIYANRLNSVDELMKIFGLEFKTIMTMDYLKQLPDINKASDIIHKHIKNNDKILIVTDYDVDGVTSAAILHLMFKNILKYDNFDVIVNRREYNNGINNTLTKMIIDYYNHDNNVKLMITADHGSSDKNNYLKIKEATDMDIIVTDHHLFGMDVAPDTSCVEAFVNPQRTENDFKEMSGAGVAYFTLLYTVLKYRENELNKEIWDKIYYYLSYIGLTLISDSRSMKDPLNRKITRKALNIINSKRTKHNPFWTVVKDKLDNSYFIDETKLSYEIIPHLNTPGRIGDPYQSYLFMVTENVSDGYLYYNEIENLNNVRKERQNNIADKGSDIEYKNKILYVGYVKNAHNLQGIFANKFIYDSIDCQIAFLFSRTPAKPDEDIYVGSGRCRNPDISIKKLLDKIASKSDIIVKHGGHDMAVGLEIKGDIKKFYNLLNQEISKYNVKESKIEIDDVIISNKKLLISMMDVKDSGPYGVEFPKPTFLSEFKITGYKIFKHKYLVMYLKLSENSDYIVRLMYTIKKDELDQMLEDLKYKKRLRAVYNISVDTYMNTNKILLNGLYIKLIDDKDD